MKPKLRRWLPWTAVVTILLAPVAKVADAAPKPAVIPDSAFPWDDPESPPPPSERAAAPEVSDDAAGIRSTDPAAAAKER